MERLRVFLSVSLLSLVLVVAPVVQVAPAVAVGSRTFTTLDFPGAVHTFLQGINNAGQIVGQYTDSTGKSHAFLFSGGTFTTLTINIPGVTIINSFAGGINNLGQSVGGYNEHGFLLSGGTATTIDVPGANFTNPLGINDSGQIVGRYCSACFFGIAAGFLFSGGSFQTIPAAPGALFSATDAQGINNSGQIVGAFETGDGRVHGYLLSSGIGGTFTTIDRPGVPGNAALGLNNSGQIVGSSFGGGFPQEAFLFSGGTFTTIAPPGALPPIVARAINDSGQIVGYFSDNAGKFHGYLASPVVPFAAFSAKVDINSTAGAFEVNGTFTLGTGSDGIKPLTEDVSFQVGTFSTAIPAGSFFRDTQGRFHFDGIINGVSLDVVISPLGGNNFAFKADVFSGTDLTGIVNPVTVGLTVGDDSGTTTVTASII